MPLNPIVYTEKVVRSFLRYQLTSYALADPRLYDQMRDQLRMDTVRTSPLLRGPYVSLSRGFRQGATVDRLIDEGVFHPHMRRIVPSRFTAAYGHQEKAFRLIDQGRPTLISTGTGSGKTECFLYPIISRCLQLRDEKSPAGVTAVIVYPMNALAEDQLDRMRGLLAGSGITFGMYIGKTPEHEREVHGHRMEAGESRADYQYRIRETRGSGLSDSVHPAEEVCSREKMRTDGCQPRILLTNTKQLELLRTRQRDVELFENARLEFLVFDEAHTFTGIQGAETACLIRRLRAFCGKGADHTTCVATSATIVDEREPDAARKFASRFFGVDPAHVETIKEEYQNDEWSTQCYRPPRPRELSKLLADTLEAVEAFNAPERVPAVYRRLTQREIDSEAWQEALFDDMRQNEVARQIRISLTGPRELATLLSELKTTVGRKVGEEELLCYLTLGAASLKDGRPLMRPVVHGFLRGITGGVVSFESGRDPKLSLSCAEEIERDPDAEKWWRPRLFSCNACGQHYLITHLKDFSYTTSSPGGGEMGEDGECFWEPQEASHGGVRVVLLDTIVNQDGQDLANHARTTGLYFCRHCGAAHPNPKPRCQACGAIAEMVLLYAVRSKESHPGFLTSCFSCRALGSANGRRYREPIREVRATSVADVHVLAQDMVHHADRKRLLLFADNRQDAAFQAGWMKDHARRFRLRGLMAEAIAGGAVSIGDVALRISDHLDMDDSYSRALIPEVWRVAPKEGSGGSHADERAYFLRIQVLREITMASNQRKGLEPWGRITVTYEGLTTNDSFIQQWANRLGMPGEELKVGVETLLDSLRRRRLLRDSQREIFSRYWHEGDREIQRGYLPILPAPNGMKLELASGDDPARVTTWMSQRNNLIRSIVRKWGVPPEQVAAFIEALWSYCTAPDKALLVPVTLRSNRGRALPRCSGVYQIDSDKIRIAENHGYYSCNRCRRRVTRRTPNQLCLAWQCDGTLEFVSEDPDNYDLQVLDQRYSMLRPEEHTAMVPQAQREKIENWFKGSTDRVNTLVCTPTLELGVDIGALDSVLLRNVPPLPANYWQRAGRAGRRHRMAVNMTYCRPVSHDRSYFNEPMRMLGGRVDPPAFNLRNEVLVAKHVAATVITRLNQLSRPSSGLPQGDRELILETLQENLPSRITHYLFTASGQMRSELFNTEPLSLLIAKHRDDLVSYVSKAFQEGWPEDEAEVTTPAAIATHVDQVAANLQRVIARLRKRLQWAIREIRRLNRVRDAEGTLNYDDEAHFKRCDRLVKQLKGMGRRRRSDAAGVDDTVTYSVLSQEGFLPGYGLDGGSIVGMAEVPRWQLGAVDFNLPRAPSMALREYVPGNLIYANGHRFVSRRFHREADAEEIDTPVFAVNVDREAIIESDRSGAAGSLMDLEIQAIPVCDVDLVHMSQISDEEENRFQLSVAIYGRELGRHNGGEAFGWGGCAMQLRRGVHYRMVNVGASSLVDRTPPELGYPVCQICGQSVSPLSSVRQIANFREKHEEWCGQQPVNVGFFADVVADSITLLAMRDQTTAYTVLESLRQAAASVLDMHLDDLQILVVGHVDRDEVDASLWDPMPGGSGLLDQLIQNYPVVVSTAAEMLAGCPSACGSSCNDCLQTFRNAYYHRFLDRHAGIEFFERAGGQVMHEHVIPSLQPSPEHNPSSPAGEVNAAEAKLKHLLAVAGFSSGQFQEQIRFKHEFRPSPNLSSTTPDVFFLPDEDDPDDQGVCIYLDGMSEHIHGNASTAATDSEIRAWLRGKGYHVLEITRVDLDDAGAMRRHFKKLGRLLVGREFARSLDDNAVFVSALSNDSSAAAIPTDADRNVPDRETPVAAPVATSTTKTQAKLSDEYKEVLDLVSGDVRKLVVQLAEKGISPPEPGHPLDDEHGVTIAESELAWPDRSLAYFTASGQADMQQFAERGWTVISASDPDRDLVAIAEAIEK
ncbi:MAG: DEAD/DEAH box helicase [Candidatus Paceibacterota bacterium]